MKFYDLQAYKNMEMTRERIIFGLDSSVLSLIVVCYPSAENLLFVCKTFPRPILNSSGLTMFL